MRKGRGARGGLDAEPQADEVGQVQAPAAVTYMSRQQLEKVCTSRKLTTESIGMGKHVQTQQLKL